MHYIYALGWSIERDVTPCLHMLMRVLLPTTYTLDGSRRGL
jgi:hypothetical protein